LKSLSPLRVEGREIPVRRCGVLVVGSGAAALAAADRIAALDRQVAGAAGPRPEGADIVVVTESAEGGTSYNAGSDKQTYYRLSLSEAEGDSPYKMAEALWEGGAAQGDIALAEAYGSVEAFCHLVSIGVPFPMDELGGFAGYRTDHDSRRRGSSIGPYTSRVMVERLREEVVARGVPLLDGLQVVALVAEPPEPGGAMHGRIFGALAIDAEKLLDEGFGLTLFIADAVVFGPGGPGGLYASSAYPEGHSGAIGLAIEIGASCSNLTESQFGLASLAYRWNVSGSYQQAVPRYVSVGAGGDEEEFLTAFFGGPGPRDTAVFLKGYQWPFDAKKVKDGGSSLIDLLVYREREIRGRRVYLDFRKNPEGWDIGALSEEARSYLERSGAAGGSPLDRLVAMNPLAAEHYSAHGIRLEREMLEVAVCAQHNNGGLAGDAWWESVDVDGLFPVGEVNGSHGVYRPGGAALNSGQVGALRAARRIVGGYGSRNRIGDEWKESAEATARRILAVISGALAGGANGGGVGIVGLDDYRDEYRSRMDRAGGLVRRAPEARAAAEDALAQARRFPSIAIADRSLIPSLLSERHLVLAQAAYLAAIASYIAAGGGSRGSALVADPECESLGGALDALGRWRPERTDLRGKLQFLRYEGGEFIERWEQRRPIPQVDDWFESVWRAFRDGDRYAGRRDLWTR
jgi:succinate dehydrogenase/fumarate reductase flavoprotein subunit